MSSQVLADAERVRHQDEVNRAATRQQYRRSISPYRSDSEKEGNLNQASSHGVDHDVSEYGEPPYPPSPYSEPHHIRGGEPIWLNARVNLYPGEGGSEDFVTDSSGRRERYVIDGFGNRVSWPWKDRPNSSFEGEEDDPDMIHLESGRIMIRSEYEAEHPMEYSSDDSVDDGHPGPSQSRRVPSPQTGRARAHHSNSEDDDSNLENQRPQTGH